MALEELSVRQTATGYWVIQSGEIELSGAITRKAAEAECEVLRQIRLRGAAQPDHRER
jgi:hypothetical protein